MSFSSDVKSELCKVKASTCCRMSECYGIMLFGRAFSIDSITVSTESEDVTERLRILMSMCFSVTPSVYASGKQKDLYIVSISDKKETDGILNTLGYHGYKSGDKLIKIQNIEDDCCRCSFIRGAFLSCGTISDPNIEYHADFTIHNEQLALELFDVLCEQGLKPKISKRNKDTIIYFKGSEYIEDLLTTVKASKYMLELAEIKVYKDMRNHYNRITNCETANITKTVNAAIEQKSAIEKIISVGEFEKLSDELKEAARLRLENPEASLTELCGILNNGISRSGLNHRLNKLISIAESL